VRRDHHADSTFTTITTATTASTRPMATAMARRIMALHLLARLEKL
jgi:hypothetical protein